MYQASKKFGDAIAGSNRKFNTRLLENEKVLVESVKNFTITSGAEEITIGSAVASYVQATIENKGIALSGKEVSLEIGVEVDGEMEYMPMGLYTIQNPKIESNKVTFTAYDRLASRCNGAYYSKLGYPVDAVDILAEISTMTGVAIDTSTLQRGIQINQRAIIEEGDYNEETEESEVITTYVNPFDGYTYKETIGFIAGLFGKFAMCGRTGMIEFRWYQGIDYEIPSNIFYNDLQETEESFSIKRLTCDNSDQTLSSGSGATGISMQNPVMTQSILDGVYNTVKGLVFTPAALRFIGDTRLDIGDIVTAVKNDGTKFTIPIISLITSYDGGLMQTIASYGNTAEEDDSDTKGPITEMAERVEYELAFVKKLMVDNLTATNATIKNLSGDVLKFKTGEFETLKTDVANFKQTFTDDLQASNAKINTLESDHATFKEATATNLNATNARIANIEADYLKATDAKLTYATITNLNTTNAEIAKLKTKDAEIDKLVATKATITDLNAAVGRVGVLESSYANLNTLVNGNLTSDNIQNLTLTSKNTTIENGMIKNAMIENLSFDKITGMDINTTNLTVHSSDGKSKWSDNTIQISDANRVRVQIGKDASNDYSMSVWDKNGNLIWDALGATEKTIQRKIIRDGIVADDANISGSKLDINSVIKEVNGSTTKLKSSTIVMNDKNQTLDVVFNEMETTVADNLSSAKLYADGKLSDAQKYALEQANSVLSSAKRYADSAVDNIEVGGRNLVLGSKADIWKNGKEIDSDGYTEGYTEGIGSWNEYYHKLSFISDDNNKISGHVTISAYVKCPQNMIDNAYFGFNIINSNGRVADCNIGLTYFTNHEKINDNTWTYIMYTTEGFSSGFNCNGTINLQIKTNPNFTKGSKFWYKKIKVEKGNKATDWTPAPEDVDQQITAAETIASQTADKFNWLVKSGTNSTDFELTDRTATLVASAININGLVKFSGLNTDLQNTINNKTNVSYLSLRSGGNNQACWKIATIKISGNYTNQDIIIGVNHRGHGYTECRIQFKNAGNPDPGLASFRQTGLPSKCWRIIKTANSTWELYLYKNESWDGGYVVKYINPYHTTGNVSVTWSGENADLPSGTTTTEQMIADQTTIDGGIITTGYISADRIAAGSITADKIDVNSIFAKDITATGTITGVNLIGATGTFSGQITATEGTIGKYEITDTCLITGSGSTCTGIGGNFAFWAGGEDSYFAPFRVGYDGQLSIEHIKVHGNQEDVYMTIAKDYLMIQDVNTSAYIGLDGFDFDFANSRIKTGDQGIELYGDTPYIDFHYNNSYNDYTSRIIAQKGWDCLNFTGSIELGADLYAGGYIYNSSGGHYTWNGRTDAYISCGNYNNTNNIYYYAGYHAFYVNGDSGSGMMYIETSGVSSRKGFRNSSDERIKKDFRHFDDDFIKSYMQLEPIKYRFKDDTDNSYHIGFKAQNVNGVLNNYGKSYNEQFGICATHHINSEYAEKTYGEKNMTEVYTLAYDELIGANTFMIQKTRKDLMHQAGRIDMQEAIINDLQTRLLQVEKTIKQSTQALV